MTDATLTNIPRTKRDQRGDYLSTGLIALSTYLLSLWMNILLVRYLGIEHYGDVIFSYQTVTVVGMMLLMETGNFARKMLASKKDRADRGQFIRWHIGFVVQNVTIFSIGYLVTICLFIGGESLGLLSLSSLHIVIWSLVSAPFVALCQLCRVYLLAFGYRQFSHMTSEFIRFGLWTLSIGMGLLYFPRPDQWDIVVMLFAQFLVMCVFTAVFCVYLCRRPLSELLACQAGRIDMQWIRVRRMSGRDASYRQLSIVALLMSAIFFATDETVAGDLGLCLAVTMVFDVVAQCFYPLVYDDINRYLKKPQQAVSSLKRIINVHRLVICLHATLIALLVVYGYEILTVFGRDNEITHWMLIGMGIASSFRSLHHPVQRFALISSGGAHLVRHCNMSGHLLMLFGGPWIVYFYGVPYLIIGYIIINLAQYVLSLCLIRSITGYFLLMPWAAGCLKRRAITPETVNCHQ